MKAEKSHNLPSPSWRPRKASSVIQFKSKGPRSRETNDVDSKLDQCPSSSSQAEKAKFFLFLSFCSQTFKGLDSAQSTRDGQTAYQVHWFKCWTHPESPSQTHSEIPGHNVIQLSWNTSNPSIKFLFPIVIFSSRNSFFVIVSNSRLKSPFLSFNFLFMLMTVVSKGKSNNNNI